MFRKLLGCWTPEEVEILVLRHRLAVLQTIQADRPGCRVIALCDLQEIFTACGDQDRGGTPQPSPGVALLA